MNEAWRLTIEIMDHESIVKLSRTNSDFRKYLENDSEYIYKKLIERDFNCIKNYKDLYLLLDKSKSKETNIYKNLCIKEGINFDCKNLVKEVNKFTSYNKAKILPIKTLITMVNSVIKCLEEKYTKNHSMIGSINKILIQNNKLEKFQKSQIWGNWYPIATKRLQDIYTPESQ